MPIQHTDQIHLIKQSARDFAEQYIRPHVMEWDETQHFPVETMKNLGRHGFLGVLVPEKYV